MTDAIVDATLNTEQQKAVQHAKGPLLIVAGAGTGKTTVITRRIAWLIDNAKIPSDAITALTFTDKAAAEMEERVDKLLSYGHLGTWISTFHAFGERILRDRGIDIGVDPGFRILSEAGQWSLLRRHVDDLPLDYYRPMGNPTKFFGDLIRHFSRLKDEAIMPDDYAVFAKNLSTQTTSDDEKAEAKRVTELATTYTVYQSLLADEGAVDYGDMIMLSLELFRKRPNVLKEYQEKYRAILVDEFQDTNIAQYELVRILAGDGNALTIVGDDDQSIYKFRGAALSNILEFKKDFPTAAEVVLTTNYRSKQGILDLAYKFIQHNNPNRLEAALDSNAIGVKGKPLDTRILKKLTADRSGNAIIELRRAATEEQENAGVAAAILALKQDDDNLTWRDFAVLFRSNDMASTIHEALKRAGVPARVATSRGMLSEPVIIDLLSYLRLLDDYREANAAYRVLSWDLLGIPMRDVMTILWTARRQTASIFETIEQAGRLGLAQRTKTVLERLTEHVKKHTELARRESVGRVFYALLDDLKLRKRYSEVASFEDQERLDALNRLAAMILRFDREADDRNVKGFLEYVRTLRDAGDDRELPEEESDLDAVHLSTMHGAKGLEFAHVFLIKLADRRFPSIARSERIPLPNSLLKDILLPGEPHLEEERRLFYVAMTRAKDGLYLSSAADYGGKTEKKPSRFISELDPKGLTVAAEEPVDQLTLDLTKVPAKKSQPKHDPERLSFSAMDAFWSCPYQYRFKQVLGIPTSPNHVLLYGSSMHGTLKDFYELVRQGKKPTLHDLKECYERNWIGEWYPSKKLLEERKAKGWAALERHYQENSNRFMKPKYLERGFTLSLSGVVVKGTIDRIDEHADGTTEIIDYKTGELKMKKQVKKEQLFIYALAAKDILGKLPDKLTYHYIDAGESLTFTPTEKDCEGIAKKIVETAAEIRKSDFTATPGMQCSWCDFRDICEFRV